MKEARKHGRIFAKELNSVIQLIPESKRAGYRTRFTEELYNPFNPGALAEIFYFDIVENPEHLGKFVKAEIHFGRSRKTSKLILKSLLENL